MTRRVGLTDLFASCGLFLLGLVVRALPAPTMLLGRDGATFFGNDAYYHVRRIWYSVVHFPEVLQRDPYMNFPEGGQPIWTPTFDWLVAASVRLGLGLPEQEVMEAWIIWIPPVLGALTVVALYFLALRYFSRRVAVVSGLLLALLPAHFWYSQLGFVDHHVVVALVTTGLLAATMSVLSYEPGVGDSRRAVYLGIAFAASLWVWPGCLLHVVVAEVALFVRLISSDRRAMAVAWGRGFALANALAFVLVLPLGLGSEWERWGRFSPLVFSEFQPLMFGLATLGFLALSEFWQRVAYPARPLDRVLQAGFAAGVLIGLTLIALPVLSEGLDASWSWLAKGENFQAGVGESKPLFRGGGHRAEEFFTRAIYLAPLVLVVFWGRVRRRADRAACFFLVGWSFALAAATLTQLRFANSFSVAWSLLLAWSLVETVSWARAQLSSRAGVRWFALAAGVLVLLFVVTPSVMSYRVYALNIVRSSKGEPPRKNYLERLQFVREKMSRWLRNNTPATEGWLDEAAVPEYGILAPWSAGHVLKYVGRRPVVQDNFGDDAGVQGFETARRYFSAGDEADALAQIEGLQVRYVIVRASENRRRSNRFPGEMQTRLDRYRGSERWMVEKGQAGAPMRFDALERHRLIYESAALWPSAETELPLYQVFEIVPGAHVEGLADPDGVVVARLEIRSPGGSTFEYLKRTRADSAGRWEMHLPYSNERFSSAVEVAEAYELTSGERRVKLRIPEGAIWSGARVRAPHLKSES